jgi:cytoskeletal protein CcmA (bactofilin family)
MQQSARVGSSVLVKGELSAQEDIVIAGRVEGTIIVEGHLVVIEGGGQVAADIAARGIIISGTVKGTLAAEERIELRNTANVEGELAAPSISMADGAIVRGRIEMSPKKVKLAAAS